MSSNDGASAFATLIILGIFALFALCKWSGADHASAEKEFRK